MKYRCCIWFRLRSSYTWKLTVNHVLYFHMHMHLLPFRVNCQALRCLAQDETAALALACVIFVALCSLLVIQFAIQLVISSVCAFDCCCACRNPRSNFYLFAGTWSLRMSDSEEADRENFLRCWNSRHQSRWRYMPESLRPSWGSSWFSGGNRGGFPDSAKKDTAPARYLALDLRDFFTGIVGRGWSASVNILSKLSPS